MSAATTPRQPGFFQVLALAGVRTVRETFARRMGRAYARGFEAGKAHGSGTPAPNPYIDEAGEPHRDAAGDVLLPTDD